MASAPLCILSIRRYLEGSDGDLTEVLCRSRWKPGQILIRADKGPDDFRTGHFQVLGIRHHASTKLINIVRGLNAEVL